MSFSDKIIYNKKYKQTEEAIKKRENTLKKLFTGIKVFVSGSVALAVIGVSAKVNSNSFDANQADFINNTLQSIDLTGDISEENVEYCINALLLEDGILPERFDKEANSKFLLGMYFDGRKAIADKLKGPEELKAVENGFYKGVYDYLGLENDGDVHTTAVEGVESISVGQYLLGEEYSYNDKVNQNNYINSKDNIAKELSDDEREATFNETYNVLNEYVASQEVNVSNYSKETANSVDNAFNDKKAEIDNMVNEANEAVEFEAVLKDGIVLKGNTSKR